MRMLHIKKKIVNESREDFSQTLGDHFQSPVAHRPAVAADAHPKIIVLTTKWVWNNPIYALVIRYLDYYPVMGGYEGLIDKLKKKG